MAHNKRIWDDVISMQPEYFRDVYGPGTFEEMVQEFWYNNPDVAAEIPDDDFNDVSLALVRYLYYHFRIERDDDGNGYQYG